MRAFPEYAKHDLFLTGESYAGVYIPMLAREILNDQSSSTRNYLRGVAVGDACMGTDVLCGDKFGPWWYEQFMYGHGQISTKLHNELLHVCGIEQLQYGVTADDCKQLLDQMDKEIGGYYGYNLYDECGAENILSADWRRPQTQKYWSNVRVPVGGALNDYPCGGVGAMTIWLNQTDVLKALHVPDGAYFFLTDNGVGFNYTLTETNLMTFYHHLVHDTDVRVLIYNGDTDPSINVFVSQNWTSAMRLPETQAWRPWTRDGKQQMGGYVTRYEGGFDFLTIRGSGHMVPQ
jgi:carboxypeptidase C (cathepsin A)